jgi:predicted transcriptional regulator
MIEVGQSLITSVRPQPASVMESFQRVNSLIPENQDVTAVDPETTVTQAIDLMRRHNYSQLPVREGDQVLGVFSYRSFALEAVKLGKEQIELGNLPISEFIEKADHVHVLADLVSTFGALERDGFVLVGQPDLLQGIVTPVDMFHYLYKVASPFILLAEIELALRQLIRACVDNQGLQECANVTLRQVYEEGSLPSTIEDMSFNDYVQIIGDGRTWPRFQKVFGGASDWQRKRTRTKLEVIRDLRNDVFHFRRKLEPVDYENLVTHRDWLLLIAKAFEARKRLGEVHHG